MLKSFPTYGGQSNTRPRILRVRRRASSAFFLLWGRGWEIPVSSFLGKYQKRRNGVAHNVTHAVGVFQNRPLHKIRINQRNRKQSKENQSIPRIDMGSHTKFAEIFKLSLTFREFYYIFYPSMDLCVQCPQSHELEE
jgi:hypothetical protein